MSHEAADLARRWGFESADAGAARTRIAALAVVAVTAAVCVAVGVAVGPLLGTGLAVACAAAAAAWVVRLPRAELRGAAPATPAGAARVEALVDALATEWGLPRPRIAFLAGDAPNALIVPGTRPVVALSHAAVESVGRTELEALLANSLIRSTRARSISLLLSAALGPIAPPVPEGSVRDDVATVAITRYPPALASVLEKADEKRGRTAPLWFSAVSRAHAPRVERIAALMDL